MSADGAHATAYRAVKRYRRRSLDQKLAVRASNCEWCAFGEEAASAAAAGHLVHFGMVRARTDTWRCANRSNGSK